MSVAETAAPYRDYPKTRPDYLEFARFLAEPADDQIWDQRPAKAQNSARFKERLSQVERDRSRQGFADECASPVKSQILGSFWEIYATLSAESRH